MVLDLPSVEFTELGVFFPDIAAMSSFALFGGEFDSGERVVFGVVDAGIEGVETDVDSLLSVGVLLGRVGLENDFGSIGIPMQRPTTLWISIL